MIGIFVKSDETSKFAIVSVALGWTGRIFYRNGSAFLILCAIFPITGNISRLRYWARLKLCELMESTIIRKGTSSLCTLGSPTVLYKLCSLVRSGTMLVGKIDFYVCVYRRDWHASCFTVLIKVEGTF